MILEVCVDSFESLLTAKSAGADRIELCSALNLGGLTPSYGLMKQASGLGGIEIFVMIRPRSGDFLYTDYEFETMKNDIEIAKQMHFDGIVIGLLKADGKLDLEKIEALIHHAKPLQVVLHRAFDEAKNPEADILRLIEMGICRILTSGQRDNASEGAVYIRQIQKEYGDQITIMPGAGVNASNIEWLYEKTGCTHYHMSGKIDVKSQMQFNKNQNRQMISIWEDSVEKADDLSIRAVKNKMDAIGQVND